jgi:phage shock protein C
LYRSRKVRMLAGVAGGLAQYFQVDPLFLRAGLVVLTLVSGAGLVLIPLAYLTLAIVVPERATAEAEPEAPSWVDASRGREALGCCWWRWGCCGCPPTWGCFSGWTGAASGRRC